LLSFGDLDNEQLEEKGDELIKNGSPKSKKGMPLHSDLVKKAIAILKNYRLNQDSKFVHPLLNGLV